MEKFKLVLKYLLITLFVICMFLVLIWCTYRRHTHTLHKEDITTIKVTQIDTIIESKKELPDSLIRSILNRNLADSVSQCILSDSLKGTVTTHISTSDASNHKNSNFENSNFWLAIIFGIIASIVSIVTLIAQISTSSNTSAVIDTKRQRQILIDLIRHLYRNLVVSYCIYAKMEDARRIGGDYTSYPSEDHLYKMKITPELIDLTLEYPKNKGMEMTHLYQNFKNYNIELDLYAKHFQNPEISFKTKYRDLQTLIFKCGYLSQRIADVGTAIWGKSFLKDIRMILEYSQKLSSSQKLYISNINKSTIENMDIDPCLISAYMSFINCIYKDISNNVTLNTIQEAILDSLKNNVEIECGDNNMGGERIHLIHFNQ